MSRRSDRYKGLGEWYDSFFKGYGEGENSSAARLRSLLGAGAGWCLDIGCGTGTPTTWRPVEAMASKWRDMLDIARRRSQQVLLADATRLPFREETFQTVVSTYLHTDVDDMAPVFSEAARVLAPVGRLVYLGVHPCFTGPFVEYDSENWRRIIHPGYLEAGWHSDSPYFGEEGVRKKVGYRHVPLSELIGALLSSELALEGIEEFSGDDPHDANPGRIALLARKDR
jgi:SAM-dependent methyltransferase